MNCPHCMRADQDCDCGYLDDKFGVKSDISGICKRCHQLHCYDDLCYDDRLPSDPTPYTGEIL